MTNAEHSFSAPGAGRTGDADTDDLRPVGAGEVNLLASLKDELTAELEEELEPLEVPERPGWAVVYSKAIDNDSLKAWRKRAKDGKGVNELRLAAIILGNQCRRIVRNGVTVTAGTDEPVTFRDAAFHDLYGVGTAREAIRAFYGLDGHVLSAAVRVTEEAGYGAELDDLDEDPTDGS